MEDANDSFTETPTDQKPPTTSATQQDGTAPSSGPPAPTPSSFTLEERIDQLCDLDQNIVQLMDHTASALSALSPQPSTTTPRTQKDAFKSSMDGLLDTLHKVDVHMKRQILSLEEAGIIRLRQDSRGHSAAAQLAASAASSAAGTALGAMAGAAAAAGGAEGDAGKSSSSAAAARASLEPNGVGSIGNLDVGWLNSRNSKVERDMEAELWGRMREFLENYDGGGGQAVKTEDATPAGEKMELS